MEAKASFQKIVDFLTNLGTQHVDVNEVKRFNRLELQGTLRSSTNPSYMLIDSVETYPTQTEKKATFNNNICAFTILGKQNVSTSRIDAYDEQNEVLDHCQQVAFEIMSRIKYEATETDLSGPLKWLYGNVELGDFHLFKVGPVFTNQLYGYRCEFTIKAKECYTPDPTKWKDMPNP